MALEKDEDQLDRLCESGVVHSIKEERNILRKIKERLTVLVKSCVRTAF